MSHPARSTLEPPDHDGHFVMIPLTMGKFAIVDEADAATMLSSGKWQAQRASRTFYAKRRAASRTILMHAVIAGSKWADHVNRNGLDNRRINLRPATVAQNIANKPPTRLNTSGYKGVSRHRGARKWAANIRVDGRATYLGLFDDPVEAARAYNAAALKAWGEFAWLNPLPSPESLSAAVVLPTGFAAHVPAAAKPPGVRKPSPYKPANRDVAVLVAQAVMEFPRTRHWGRYLAWRAGVKMGKMKPVLRRFAENGWLEEECDPGRDQWRYYAATDTGRDGFAAMLAAAEEHAA